MERGPRARSPNRLEAILSTRLLPSGALLDELASAIQRHGRPLYALFTTYTFDAHLFASQFLPLLCGEYAEDEQKVGLLVVCDARMYTGHHLGPWVTTWPTSELFHPKIGLLVFRDLTLLIAGSANLTHAGQYEQIEILGKETWDRGGLPSGLAPLVSRLNGPLPRELLRLPRLRSRSFACSLESSFAKRLKLGRTDEIVVVSPFFDARESAEPDDLSFVADLVKRHEPGIVRLVVPIEPGTGRDRRPRTQIDPRILDGVGRQLRLYGIDPVDAGRPLHAKVLGLCRRDRVRLLFGSANATMAGMNRRNVEAGWFVETTRPEFLHWLRHQGLFECPLDPKAVRPTVRPPKPEMAPRSPLQRACLDEVDETLTLVWRAAGKVAGTQVIYEGTRLFPRGDVIHGFHLRRDWFVRIRVAGQKRLSFAPIEIERDLPGSRRELRDGDVDPESLLERLVAAPDIESPAPDGSSVRRGPSGRQSSPTVSEEEPLFERVRRVAGAMAMARRQLEGEVPQRLATVTLLLRIARAHNPIQRLIDSRTALWRYWVRAEVARVLSNAPRSRTSVEARRAVNLLLEPKYVPREIRATARLIRRGVAR
jgi:hypothetical protein